MMKVLGTSKFGRKHLSFIADHPKPCPQSPTDVIIKVEYSDLNPVDQHKLNSKPDGTPTPSHRTPFIVGFGGSGIVESVSETADEQTRALLHERVYILCDRRLVAKIPDIDDDNSVESNDDDTALPACSSYEGASIPIAGCTALESLEKVGLRITSYIPAIMGTTRAGEGKRLLIVGGSGGVGSWITQLARSNYPKLSIVCTVGSEESAVWCKKMGCSGTIGHDEIETLGGGPKGSCDYIICLTEPTTKLFASIAEVLRPYGKICLVVAGEGIKKLDMSFIFFKCGTVSTETVFSSIRDGYHLDQAGEMEKILKLMKQGRVTAPMSEDWDDAKSDWNQCNEEGGYIDLVGSGHTRGKFVMKIGE